MMKDEESFKENNISGRIIQFLNKGPPSNVMSESATIQNALITVIK